MYLTIREYQANPNSVEQILREDEKSFVPAITKAEGFREYYCIAGGNGTLTSVSLFATLSDGEKFNQIAQDWVLQNLGSHLPTAPKVMSGEVRIHASGKVALS